MTVASIIKEVNPRLAKRPLVFNGHLANCRLTSLGKEATGVAGHQSHHEKCGIFLKIVICVLPMELMQSCAKPLIWLQMRLRIGEYAFIWSNCMMLSVIMIFVAVKLSVILSGCLSGNETEYMNGTQWFVGIHHAWNKTREKEIEHFKDACLLKVMLGIIITLGTTGSNSLAESQWWVLKVQHMVYDTAVMHCSDVTWVPWCLRSLTTWIFIEKLVKVYKESIIHKKPWYRKCIHVTMPSCIQGQRVLASHFLWSPQGPGSNLFHSVMHYSVYGPAWMVRELDRQQKEGDKMNCRTSQWTQKEKATWPLSLRTIKIKTV